MSVDIGQVIEEGGKRTIARNGLYLVALWWVLGVISTLFFNTVMQNVLELLARWMGPDAPPINTGMTGVTLGLSFGLAGVLWIVVALALTVVGAAALRTFVTDETEKIPIGNFTRNLPLMLLNLIIGGIVLWIALAIGFALLFFPGLFLLVSLFFWNVYIVVEDEDFVEAFQHSWALTSGNRIMLFVLGVVVVIISVVVSGIFSVVGGVMPNIVGLAISQVGSALVAVFGTATVARTFLQLTEEGVAAAAEEAAAPA